MHTGGTTGAPKVAAHTHANQLACARGIAVCSGLAPGEGVLGGLPLFHVNALIVTGIAPGVPAHVPPQYHADRGLVSGELATVDVTSPMISAFHSDSSAGVLDGQ